MLCVLRNIRAKARLMSTVVPTVPDKYSSYVQITHFAMGGSIMACIGLVQVAQFYKGKEKMELMFYHKSFGLLAAGLLAPRIIARVLSKSPIALPGKNWEHYAANLTHIALTGFTIAMPITGVVMGYYGGKGLPFFYTTVPGAAKADGAIAKQSFKFHKLIGHYGQYIVPAHVGAVGYHFFIKGKNILPRMFSFLGVK